MKRFKSLKNCDTKMRTPGSEKSASRTLSSEPKEESQVDWNEQFRLANGGIGHIESQTSCWLIGAGLDVKDGFIQRSVSPPSFLKPERFYKWFLNQKVPLLERNN